MPVTRTCKACGKLKLHHAKGLCKTCYNRTRERRGRSHHSKVVCKECGNLGIHYGHGLCSRCYARRRYRSKQGHKVICKECGQFKIHAGHGLCRRCYTKLIATPKAKDARNGRRRKLIEMFGGQCSLCDYDRNPSVLTFHHLDPTQKEFRIAGGELNWAWDRLVKEASKCTLLCHNCHHLLEYKNHTPKRRRSELCSERRTMRLLHYRCKGDIKCMRCGYDKHPVNLVFHHRVPTTKTFNIGWAISRPMKIAFMYYLKNKHVNDRTAIIEIGMRLLKRETHKCDVLCHNCHYEVHYPMTGQTFTGRSIQNSHFGSALSPS